MSWLRTEPSCDALTVALEVLVGLQTETRHMTSNEWWDGRAGLTPNYVGVKYILRYEVPSSVPQKNTLRIIHN